MGRKKLRKCRTCNVSINNHKSYCSVCKILKNGRTKDWSKITIGQLRKERNENRNRTTVWEMARREYERSNKPKCCLICGYDLHYDVCHFKAVRLFDDNVLIETVNSLDNLIALCRNHHWEFDNDKLSREDKEKLTYSCSSIG